MSTQLIILIIATFALVPISASGQKKQEKRIDFLEIGTLDQCEGKDANNYTFLAQWTDDPTCTGPALFADTDTLTACMPNGQKVVNELKTLAESDYPAGAYYQDETLYLAISGNLEGKYLYLKDIGLRDAYNKKCSSVLGYSYESTKSFVLLIAEKLDLNVLLSPNGGYEPFKRSAQTVCHGRAYIL